MIYKSDLCFKGITDINAKQIMASEEEDELDAYMAELEKAEALKTRSELIDQDSTSEDEGDNLGGNKDDETVEDIEADLKATIAGTKAPANKTTKMLNEIAKRKIDYPDFTKNFYVEVPELTRLSEDDVKELRLSLENIKVIGKSCPKPVLSWAHCGLSKKIMDVLKKCQYSHPTPIQAQAIPAIMSGRDVIGIAKTGCGKTLSFLLPMFRHIKAQPELRRGDGPIGLVITPTRELATQICSDALKFTKILGLRVASIYGGPNISEQIAVLKPGAEIVVCTPGRLIEILTVNGGRVTNLNRCTFLVLDEADRLFDMGFERQIRSIVDLIRPDRQTVMFSATFPRIMEAHARKILDKPIEIQVGGRSVVCKEVEQKIQIIDEDDKFLELINILQRHVDMQFSAIIFVSKQAKADSLLDDLLQAYSPHCLALHGGIDKDDRMSTFASFKSGQTKVLVATSVAARGLDVPNCICVVNYDVPNHYEDYVHRCGRTGRAGRKGFSYTFITPEQGNYAADLIKALELSENQVPPDLQKLWDEYKETAEKLGKKVWASSGFSGRGFKFDEAEANINNEKKNYQKKSLGLQGSDDEDADEQSAIGGGTTDQELAELGIPLQPSSIADENNLKDEPACQSNNNNNNNNNNDNSNTNTTPKILTKLDLVKQRAEMILARKNILPIKKQQDLGSITSLMGDASINVLPQEQVKLSTKQKIETKLEINDYNQQARRRLTSKEDLAKISETCGVGVTVKGQFCAPGDRPIEPKLYLSIEGPNQQSLDHARRELLLIVKDEYTKISKKTKMIV